MSTTQWILAHNLNESLSFLVAYAPDLSFVTKAWGTITVHQAQFLALEAQANIEVANDYILFNRQGLSPGNLSSIIDEFQRTRGLISLEGLSLEDRAYKIKGQLLDDLFNLKRSAGKHVAKRMMQ